MTNGRPHRDPDTGQLTARGGWAWIADILKLWPVLLALAGYIMAHEIRHDRITTFMKVGERLTPEMAARIHAEMDRDWSTKFSGLPPRDTRIRLDKIEQQVSENAGAISELKVSVTEMDARLSAELRAIRIILERE